jgi:hypothetical protein
MGKYAKNFKARNCSSLYLVVTRDYFFWEKYILYIKGVRLKWWEHGISHYEDMCHTELKCGCKNIPWNMLVISFVPMLGGSLFTSAWLVLRLRMEEAASGYEEQLRIYWINNSGEPTRGGLPAWGLGVDLIMPHFKKISMIRKITRSLGPGRIPRINDLCDKVQTRGVKVMSRVEVRVKKWRILFGMIGIISSLVTQSLLITF